MTTRTAKELDFVARLDVRPTALRRAPRTHARRASVTRTLRHLRDLTALHVARPPTDASVPAANVDVDTVAAYDARTALAGGLRRAPRQHRRPVLRLLDATTPYDRPYGTLHALPSGELAWCLHGEPLFVSAYDDVDARALVAAAPPGAQREVPLRALRTASERDARFPTGHRSAGDALGWPGLVLEQRLSQGSHGVVVRVRPVVAWRDAATGAIVTPEALGVPQDVAPGPHWVLKIMTQFREAQAEFRLMRTAQQRLWRTHRAPAHVLAPIAHFSVAGLPPTRAGVAPYDSLAAFMQSRIGDPTQNRDRRGTPRSLVDYLLMAAVDGDRLTDEAGRPAARLMGPRWTLPVLFQLWAALTGLHLSGIVHRDLSVGNVMGRRRTPRENAPRTPRPAAVTMSPLWSPDQAARVRAKYAADVAAWRTRARPRRYAVAGGGSDLFAVELEAGRQVPVVQIIDLGNALAAVPPRSTDDPLTQFRLREPMTTPSVRPPEHYLADAAVPAYARGVFTPRSDVWAAGLLTLQLAHKRTRVRRHGPFVWADPPDTRGRQLADAAFVQDPAWNSRMEARGATGKLSPVQHQAYVEQSARFRCVPPYDFVVDCHREPARRLAQLDARYRALDPRQAGDERRALFLQMNQLRTAFGGRAPPRSDTTRVYEAFHVWNLMAAFGTPPAEHYAGALLYELWTSTYRRYTSLLVPDRDTWTPASVRPARALHRTRPRASEPFYDRLTAQGWLFDRDASADAARFRDAARPDTMRAVRRLQDVRGGLYNVLNQFKPSREPDRGQHAGLFGDRQVDDATVREFLADRVWTGRYWVRTAVFFDGAAFFPAPGYREAQRDAWATVLHRALRYGQHDLGRRAPIPRLRAGQVLTQLLNVGAFGTVSAPDQDAPGRPPTFATGLHVHRFTRDETALGVADDPTGRTLPVPAEHWADFGGGILEPRASLLRALEPAPPYGPTGAPLTEAAATAHQTWRGTAGDTLRDLDAWGMFVPTLEQPGQLGDARYPTLKHVPVQPTPAQ